MICLLRPGLPKAQDPADPVPGSDLLCDRYTLCDISLMTFRPEELSQK